MSADTTLPLDVSAPSSTLADVKVADFVGVFLLGAVMALNEANFRPPDIESAALDWQVALKLVVCLGCGFYGLWFLPRTLPLLLNSAGLWAVAFSAWALMTSLAAVNFGYSFVSAAALWGVLLFAPPVLLQLGIRRVVMTMIVALLLFLVASWATWFVAPELNGFDPDVALAADAARFGGLLHPNGTGRLAATLIALLLVAGRMDFLRWRTIVPLTGFAALTLLLTGSRTYILATVAVGALAWWSARSSEWRLIGTSALFVLLGTALLLLVVSPLVSEPDSLLSPFSRSGRATEIYSMTGRTYLWEFALEKIGQSPLAGYGYSCERFVIAREHFWPTRHAHNVLLSAMLATGVPGGLLLLGAMLWQGSQAIFRPRLFPDLVLLLVLIGGLADCPLLPAIPGATTLLWLMALQWRALEGRPEVRAEQSGSRAENAAEPVRAGNRPA